MDIVNSVTGVAGSVGTTAQALFSAQLHGAISYTIQNKSGTNSLYVSNTGTASATNGFTIGPNATFTLPFYTKSAPSIVASGAATAYYVEYYRP